MTKESVIELQKIDCNCNDCSYMQRDFIEYQKWEEIKKNSELEQFNTRKEKAIQNALLIRDEKQRKSDLNLANKMKFQYTRSIIQYGNCTLFNKPVSFIPGTCQILTQSCFKSRRNEL